MGEQTSEHRCGRSGWVGKATRCTLAVAALWAGGGLAGCVPEQSGGPESADKMSTAEYDLARDAFGRQRLREALEHVQKAAELDDDNADAAYLGCVILLAFCAQDERSPDCRYGEAERYARMTLETAPDMRDAKNALGVILIHQKRYEDAIGVLEPLANDIIYASPEKAWGNLGWAYLEAGKTDQAIQALERAVAAQPNFCVGHYRLGLAFQRKGQHAAARDALSRAVSITAGECAKLQDAFAARAASHKALGAQSEASSDFERCRDLAPSTPTGKRCASELAQQR